jgi:hypothetical protein
MLGCRGQNLEAKGRATLEGNLLDTPVLASASFHERFNYPEDQTEQQCFYRVSRFIGVHGNAEKYVDIGGRTRGECKETECCCMKSRSAASTGVTSPDELMTVLKRYLRESNESEIVVASRIGVNHHT